MKLSPYLAAGLLAVSIAASAQAQTRIYITGSTAYRGATTAAINAVLGVSAPSDYTGATPGSANAQTWKVPAGNPTTIVKTSWSGSNAGVQTVAQAGTTYLVNFLPDSASGSGQPDPRGGGAAGTFEAAKPDIAMVDNFQSSSIFNGTLTDVNNHTETYAKLTDAQVGIIPFQWVASKGFPTQTVGSTTVPYSMTPNIAKYLYGSAVGIPLAVLTGSSSHETVGLYGSGRDTDSGTRVNTFAETGIGVFSLVNQWKPTITSGSITSITPYPTVNVNGFSTTADGNSGESSGGTLAGYMGNNFDPAAADPFGFGQFTSAFLVGYLGVSDAATAVTAGGVALRWNGVDFSAAAVKEGSYTFWGIEHIMWQSSLAGAKLTFANNLKSAILTADPTPNVKLSDMQVTRAKEGALITAKYF